MQKIAIILIATWERMSLLQYPKNKLPYYIVLPEWEKIGELVYFEKQINFGIKEFQIVRIETTNLNYWNGFCSPVLG
jgi:hypothetical protein